MPSARGNTGGKMFTSAGCTKFPHPLLVMDEAGCQFFMMSEIVKKRCEVLMNVAMNYCVF